jgi:hypothetical protein
MKQTFFSITLYTLFLSCGKDDTSTPTPSCVKKDLTTTLTGKWKLSNNAAILEFKADKTYTDVSKALHSCTAGKWAAISNDTKIDLICGRSFKEVRLNKYTCDTINLQLSGIGAANMIRQ